MKKILFLFLSFPLLVASQNWKTVPDVFTTQCKTSFIDDINSGAKRLQDLRSNSDRYWLVYSDRENNRLKNTANGSNNGSVLNYMEALYVKEVNDNWLHVYGYENEDEKGWIEARYLLLSLYSLKTEGNISVPRKAMLVLSLDELVEGDVSLEKILDQKNYYDDPSPQNGKIIGKPNKFEILFVMKEMYGSVLLSTTDRLHIENKTKIKGWVPKAYITEWNSRIALEPSRFPDAIEEYYGKNFPIYLSLNNLKHCLKQGICSEREIMGGFEVGNILSEQFRYPLINSIDENIKEICKISSRSKRDDSLQSNGSILGPGSCTDVYDAPISYYLSIRGFVALDYHGSGINALEPVVLLTERELIKLKKSLTRIMYDRGMHKQDFEECLILIYKSILGQNMSTSSIENMTFNQFWQKLFGVDYYFKPLRDLSLNDISSINKKDFKIFYREFSKVANDFFNESYIHSNLLKSRRFTVAGSNLYWIPLEDLPGCKFVE